MSDEQKVFMEELEKLLDQHGYDLPKVGDIRKGVIVATSQRGIIVDLGLKRDGLVPPTDLNKLEPEERDAFQVNDEISVYVLNTDDTDNLIVSIHMAQLNQDWITAEEHMKSGEIVELEVAGYNKGGAIVPFGHLRGFIPASHLSDLTPGMSDRKRQQRLAKLRTQKVPVKVIEVDRRRRRLVFSQRDAQKEWEEKRKQELLQNLKEGDVLKGVVTGLRDFGIFVNLGGADGLVHISELAWHRVDHPREVVKVGDELDVQVLKLDPNDQRISLSRKNLIQNPWTTVLERYKLNQLVEGKVSRIVDYGAFAEIEPGIEGLLHLSQLSKTPVQNAHDIVQEGEMHLLRVISIDQERQRIGLSLKAVTTNEQIEWMAQRPSQPEPVPQKASKMVDDDDDEDDDIDVTAVETHMDDAPDAEAHTEVAPTAAATSMSEGSDADFGDAAPATPAPAETPAASMGETGDDADFADAPVIPAQEAMNEAPPVD